MAGQYINIQNSYSSAPYISPGATAAGMIRWNPNTQNFEINDGAVWHQYTMANPTIELNNEAQELLDFVKKQRDRQRLVEQNPALQKAYEAINRAEENFDLLEKISREYENTSNLKTN